MEQLAAEIQKILASLTGGNAALATVASGGMIVWVITNLRSIFSAIANAVKSIVSFTIVNNYEINRHKDMTYAQQAFNEILTKARPIWDRSRNFDFEQYDRDGAIGDSSTAYGMSVRILNGRLAVVTRSIESNNTVISMRTTVRVFFARKDRFTEELIGQINANMTARRKSQDEENVVFVNIDDNSSYARKYKRSLSSIFTNGNVHLGLDRDIVSFIENEDTYRKLNYPYSYSALLYGEPGSGKSSTILAIASELNRRIEYINMTKITLGELQERFRRPTKDRIYVFEDIDALTTGVTQRRDESGDGGGVVPLRIPTGSPSTAADKILNSIGISLSDLLNITDGLLSSDGAICMFTTNHIENLDPALLRAGRMNRLVKFEYLNGETAGRMANTYLDCNGLKFKDGIKPAELQEQILGVLLGMSSIDEIRKRFCVDAEAEKVV